MKSPRYDQLKVFRIWNTGSTLQEHTPSYALTHSLQLQIIINPLHNFQFKMLKDSLLIHILFTSRADYTKIKCVKPLNGG